MKYTREQIEKTVNGKGYRYFVGYNYDVNIIGIRNSDTKNKVTNKFDDTMTVSYRDGAGDWHYHEFDCTTDPGTHWVENVMNKDGCAILKPGQYRRSHKIRLHLGQYEALGQQNEVCVYRDNNRDSNYDLLEKNIQCGLFGINIHRATKYINKKSTQIDKWSAGCQVIASNNDWKLFMKLMRKAKDNWGNNFTNTLIESKYMII